MEDLDLLGAEGLASQFITLRVKGVDKAKLAQALGGGAKGAAIPAALAVADFAPRQALELAMPLVVTKAGDYGVDLEYQISAAPPEAGTKPKSQFGKGLVLGAALGAGGLWAWSRFGLRALLGRAGL